MRHHRLHRRGTQPEHVLDHAALGVVYDAQVFGYRHHLNHRIHRQRARAIVTEEPRDDRAQRVDEEHEGLEKPGADEQHRSQRRGDAFVVAYGDALRRHFAEDKHDQRQYPGDEPEHPVAPALDGPLRGKSGSGDVDDIVPYEYCRDEFVGFAGQPFDYGAACLALLDRLYLEYRQRGERGLSRREQRREHEAQHDADERGVHLFSNLTMYSLTYSSSAVWLRMRSSFGLSAMVAAMVSMRSGVKLEGRMERSVVRT